MKNKNPFDIGEYALGFMQPPARSVFNILADLELDQSYSADSISKTLSDFLEEEYSQHPEHGHPMSFFILLLWDDHRGKGYDADIRSYEEVAQLYTEKLTADINGGHNRFYFYAIDRNGEVNVPEGNIKIAVDNFHLRLDTDIV